MVKREVTSKLNLIGISTVVLLLFLGLAPLAEAAMLIGRRRILAFITCLITVSASMSGFAQQPYLTDRPEWAGWWMNTGSIEDVSPFSNFMAGETFRPKWKQMETNDGDYSTMYDAFGYMIERAYLEDKYLYCPLWMGGQRPRLDL
jgi:hypothetical protein